MNSLRIGVCYNFRNPPDSDLTDSKLYDEILEKVKLLNQI